MQNELVRLVIHPRQQVTAFIYDRCPATPGEDGSEKSGDLDILLFGKQMRDTDGVCFNERRLIILVNLPVKKFLQLPVIHLADRLLKVCNKVFRILDPYTQAYQRI